MNNLSLYHLGQQHQELLSQLYDLETGEINMEVQAQLDALEPSVEKKCMAIASWVKQLQSEKSEVCKILMELCDRDEAYQNKINKLNDYLKSNMEKCGISEVRCPYFTLRLKKNPYSTHIVDETIIPEKFMRRKEIIKVEVKPDKTAIKEEVLKTGEQIPGAHVYQCTKLEILTDKI